MSCFLSDRQSNEILHCRELFFISCVIYHIELLKNSPMSIRASYVINTGDIFVLMHIVLQFPLKVSVDCFKWHLRKPTDMTKSRFGMIHELSESMNVWFINGRIYVSVEGIYYSKNMFTAIITTILSY